MRSKHIRGFMLLVAVLGGTNVWAAESRGDWSVSPYLGLYHPSLKLLNKGEFLSPYVGTADLIDQFGNNNNVTVPLIYRNPLPELSPGTIGISVAYQ